LAAADSPDSTALFNPEHEHWARPAPELYRVTFETSKGEFVVEAHRDWAPLGADRFFQLVTAGFYDDSRFFRVRSGYITQFGLPGDPAVARRWVDREIPDDPVVHTNVRGTVAFAMTGPDTRTTQIYINMVDNSHLDSQSFAPFGRVVEGMEVVERLYSGYDESAGGGMRGGKQGQIIAGGNTHLDSEFPLLDRLTRATVLTDADADSDP
jgi:homoserine O-acetyltransferase